MSTITVRGINNDDIKLFDLSLLNRQNKYKICYGDRSSEILSKILPDEIKEIYSHFDNDIVATNVRLSEEDAGVYLENIIYDIIIGYDSFLKTIKEIIEDENNSEYFFDYIYDNKERFNFFNDKFYSLINNANGEEIITELKNYFYSLPVEKQIIIICDYLLKNGIEDRTNNLCHKFLDILDIKRKQERSKFARYDDELSDEEISSLYNSVEQSSDDITESYYNNDDEKINVGDYVKVVKGRKIPLGTIAKVVRIDTEGYGGAYRDDEGNSHAITNGWYNNTTYLYLDNNMRTNINNCVLATKEEIEGATILVPPNNKLEIGDTITFNATVKFIPMLDKPYDRYEFHTDDGKVYYYFARYNFEYDSGNFTAEIKDITNKYGKEIIRIHHIIHNK